MREVRSRVRRRGAIVTLLTAFAVLVAASVVAASASARSASPPVICVRVPQSGLLPPGQSASTQLEPSSQWQWSASSAHQPFRWQLINRYGVVVASGSSPGTGGSILVPFNYYRWKVTNEGYLGQYWTACWSSQP